MTKIKIQEKYILHGKSLFCNNYKLLQPTSIYCTKELCNILLQDKCNNRIHYIMPITHQYMFFHERIYIRNNCKNTHNFKNLKPCRRKHYELFTITNISINIWKFIRVNEKVLSQSNH